jgi:YebC/PmpR family DNA-binding regulatory protein
MSGHSKWSSIKHKKGAADAKRGKLFTKLIREITTAARIGGGDINGNPRLRTAVAEAKAQSMPKDNIERAIKKGTGELEGAEEYVEVTYEGYGPGGMAVIVETLTENRNRTVADVRHLFSKFGGNLGETNSVQWMFERKGQVRVAAQGTNEEQVFEIAAEAGAEDVEAEDSSFLVSSAVENLESVRSALEAAGLTIESAEMAFVPNNTVSLSGSEAERALKLLDALEDNDDVQNVSANCDIDDDEMRRLSA